MALISKLISARALLFSPVAAAKQFISIYMHMRAVADTSFGITAFYNVRRAREAIKFLTGAINSNIKIFF